MFLSDPSALTKLQSRPSYIRNLCILAHVDHGKTTLSDYLLSSNGVISRALAGKVRFLDSRADEQERQITMKSSSIALVFQDRRRSEEKGKERALQRSQASSAQQPPAPSPIPSPLLSSPAADASSIDQVYLINLIDSPGHVDFSSEVSTAVRSSDGALVLVDVIEGLCVQTSAVLRQAWREGVRPVLVLNKLDRLIVEVRMSAAEAYAYCAKLIETINAVASTFITSDAAMSAATADSVSSEVDIDDDKQVIFSPEKGNVLFASAHDCWAFSLLDFARLYARLLGMKEAALQQCLWGEWYYVAKEKKVVKKPTAKQSKVMCVQFVFDVLWQVYAAVLAEDDSAEKVIAMMDRVGVSVTARELSREKEKKRRLQLVMQKWLPISNCVLGCVVDQLPSPAEAQKERLERVWSGEVRRREGEEELGEAMRRCDQHYPEVMVYVSKMVDYASVLDKMRERAKQGASVRAAGVRRAYVKGRAADAGESKEDEQQIDSSAEEERKDGEEDATVDMAQSASDSQRFLGFARVFAGTLTTTTTSTSSASHVLHVYLPRYHPSSPLHHLTIPVSSLSLYLFMGVDLQPVTSVPAGNVCGIAGLDAVVLKAATLSSLPPPLSPFLSLSFQSAPIMRVALEPENANDFPAFRRGLHLLQHADPNVVVTETERGETVLIVSGELHLERCVRDLKDRFAVGVAVRVSAPMVAFREGLVREDNKAKDEVDFRAKKEKEKERKGKEKTRRKKGGAGDEEEDAAAAAAHLREGEKKRGKELDERKRKEKEREREEKGEAALSVETEREAAASPLPSVDEGEASLPLDSASSLDPADKHTPHRHEVEEWTANKGVMIRVRCVPLGPDVMKLLEEGRSVIKHMARKRHREETRLRKTAEDATATVAAGSADKQQKRSADAEPKADAVDDKPTAPPPPVPLEVEAAVEGEEQGAEGEDEEGDEQVQDEDDLIASRSSHKYTTATFLAALCSLFGSPSCPDLTPDDVTHIWSFGPKRFGPNLLINRTDLSPLTSFIVPPSAAFTATSTLDPSRVSMFRGVETGLVNGFQMATSAGPICEEPMMGVAFLVTSLTLQAAAPSGSVISSSRSACRRSFLTHQHHLRLLEAVYLVHLQCSTAELGHLYPVLARRRGRIVGEDLQEGTNLFLIVAYLPLAESFGFSSEVRKATGGEAQPQLIFSHWELMEQDPFYQPRTEEDIERTGVVEEGRNVSREWVERVRKRKGLFVEKVVEHGEKQRTLARKK